MSGSALGRSELNSVLVAARHAFFAIGLFSAIINILAITGSMFMLEVYDRVLPSRSVPTLIVLSILTGSLFAFYGLLDMLRSRVLVRIGASVDAALSRRIYRTIVRLPLSRGRLAEGVQPLRDLDAVRSFLSSPAPSVLFDLPWVPFYLGVIYLFHPLLALLALSGHGPADSCHARHRVAHASTDEYRQRARCRAPALGRDQSPQRRDADRYGDVRLLRRTLGQGQ
jgi:ATP-binding cassette subfamily C protein